MAILYNGCKVSVPNICFTIKSFHVLKYILRHDMFNYLIGGVFTLCFPYCIRYNVSSSVANMPKYAIQFSCFLFFCCSIVCIYLFCCLFFILFRGNLFKQIFSHLFYISLCFYLFLIEKYCSPALLPPKINTQ